MMTQLQKSTVNALPRRNDGVQSLHLLLLEPDYMIRRTVSGTARYHGLANIREVADLETAMNLMSAEPFDGAILALTDGDPELNLVCRVRAGQTACASHAGMAVTVEHCDATRLQRLRAAGVSGVMIRPFKVKTLLKTIGAMQGPLAAGSAVGG